jgi:hypothetical protein
LHEVLDDFVMVRMAHLASGNANNIHVSPASFNPLATGMRSTHEVIEIECTFAFFTVCLQVKLWHSKGDNSIIRKLIDIALCIF